MILPHEAAKAIRTHKAMHPAEFHEPELTMLSIALIEYHNLLEQVDYNHKTVTADDIVQCVHKSMTFSWG